MSKYINLDEATDLFRGIDATMAGSFVADTLESLPTIEVSEDAISREQLKSLSYINKGNFNSVEGIRDWIDAAPSVIPQPKEGEWIYIDEPIIGNPYGRYRCSECELEQPYEKPYCPECGSKNV